MVIKSGITRKNGVGDQPAFAKDRGLAWTPPYGIRTGS